MGFIDVNLMVKILRFTGNIDSLEITNSAKVSILTPPLRGFEQSILQDFESFLRTNKLEESDRKFLLENSNSNFDTYEIPPPVFEVSGIDNALDNFMKANVFF